MTFTDSILPLIGGVAGATLIYFTVMVAYTYMRHKRETRMEQRQIRIERMVRDTWLDWLRRGRQ